MIAILWGSALQLIAAYWLLFGAVHPAFGDIVKYSDETGRVHYVDDESKVPEQYRASVQGTSGRVSKLPAREYSKDADSPVIVDSPREVAIFLTSWCPYCKKAEQLFKDKHVKYTRYDVEHDPVGKKKFEQLGGGGFPLIKIGSKIFHGFNEKKLTDALGIT